MLKVTWSLIVLLGSAVLLIACNGQTPVVMIGEPELPDHVLWFRLGLVTDVHITDEESPARFVRLDGFAGMFNEAWRPQEAYAVHGLDSAVRALNRWHTEIAKLDAVWVLGDVTDNAHANELEWFIQTMDGNDVLADSGAADGSERPIPPELNPKLLFRATGLAVDLPWYVVRGNHDALCSGVFSIRSDAQGSLYAPLPGIVAWLIGLWEVLPFQNALYPTTTWSPAVILGNGPTVFPDTLQLDKTALNAGRIVPDNSRRFLSRREFVTSFLNSSSLPSGHGFTLENLLKDKMWYSVRPVADVPLRFIVLDTVAEEAPAEQIADYGVMTAEQFNDFLVPEVSRAKTAGEFVVVVSHHPSTDFDRPYPRPTVGTSLFRQYLAFQPHVLAHFCGHTHAHKVTVVPGKYPYPEIETASLIDLPQEMRIVEILYNTTDRSAALALRPLHVQDELSPLGAEFVRRAERDSAATGLIYTEPIGDRVFYVVLSRPDFAPAGSR